MTGQTEHVKDLLSNRLETFLGRLEPWEISDLSRLIFHVELYAQRDQIELEKELLKHKVKVQKMEHTIKEVMEDLRKEKLYTHSDKLRSSLNAV